MHSGITAAQFQANKPLQGAFLNAIANAGYVYVTNYNDGTVSVINPSGTVVATLTVGTAPIGVVVSPSGVVYVANSADNTVSVITG